MSKIRIVVLLIGFCTLMIGLSGCKLKNRLIKPKGKTGQIGLMIDQVQAGEMNYRSLEIRSSTKTDIIGGRNYSFSLIYRNELDSLIWLSARAVLGIEAARMICTPDSIWIVSRLAQVEEKGDWESMSDLFGYPLDFYSLQAMMSRKLFMPGNRNELLKRMLMNNMDTGVLLAPDFSRIPQRDLLKKHGFMPHFKLNNRLNTISLTKLVPEKGEWLLEVDYGDEGVQEFHGLPDRFKIHALDQKEEYSFDLKIIQVKLDEELKYSFPWF